MGIKISGGRLSWLGYTDVPSTFVFFFFFFNWRLITLPYCSGFCHTLTNESVMGVHVSPILNPPPPSLPHLPPSQSTHSGLSLCSGFEHPVLGIELALVIYFTYGNIHVSLLFSQIIPPSLSPTESKSLFFISLSLLLSLI